MWKIWTVTLIACSLLALDIQRPQTFRDQNISGWVMSEKLDGVRGYWDGKKLMTKQGYRIAAPDYFIHNFPPFPLDGELWIARSAFEAVQSIVLDSTPSDRWKTVTYNIFEVPYAEGRFLDRLNKAKKWFQKHRNRYVHIIRQRVCHDRKELNTFLHSVEAKGGEGVVIKNPQVRYVTGRSDQVLKVKSFQDAEGVVLAINPGKGRNSGKMGSLTLRLDNGKTFRLGNGFSAEERMHAPKIGSIVTFKYYGLTKNGLPKFASYMRTRSEKTATINDR